jgi:general secretion pathway protein C
VLGPALASKVKSLGSGTFLVERPALEAILGQATELLRRVKIRPSKMGEKVVGFELQRVAPGTLLDVLGLKNGDVLQSVNGFELTGPAQALQAYARLRLADNVRVKALRNGVPVELEYQIR